MCFVFVKYNTKHPSQAMKLRKGSLYLLFLLRKPGAACTNRMLDKHKNFILLITMPHPCNKTLSKYKKLTNDHCPNISWYFINDNDKDTIKFVLKPFKFYNVIFKLTKVNYFTSYYLYVVFMLGQELREHFKKQSLL